MNEPERSLLHLALDGDATREEREAVDELLDTSSEARASLEELRAIHALVAESAAGRFSSGFADRVLERLPDRPPLNGRTVDRPSRQPLRRHRRLFGVLAAAAAMAAVVLLWMHPVQVTAERGEQRIVRLPDGSQAELNSGTTLSYRRSFAGGNRVVRLSGEAFFAVEPQVQPFVVETFNARVTVLGTRFNVRTRPEDASPSTSVGVAAGRVLIESPTYRSPVLLEAAEFLMISSDSVVSSSADSVRLSRATAWRQGGLAFVDESLGSILPELERRFDVDIALSSASIGPRRVTYLNPSPHSAAGVLADICQTIGLRYRQTAAGFIVFDESQAL